MIRISVLVVCLAASACLRLGFETEKAELRPYDYTWTVTTVADRLAGPEDLSSPADLDSGIEGLSLREALLIASHSSGSDLVQFDPATFPAAAPVVITLDRPLPGLRDLITALDGTEAGVVIDGTAVSDTFLHIYAHGAELRGLTLRGFDGAMISVQGAEGAIIADLQLEAAGGLGIEVDGAADLLISGNTVAGAGAEALVVRGSRGVKLIGNTLLDAGSSALVVSDSSELTIADNRVERSGAHAIVVTRATTAEIFRNAVVLENKEGVRGLVLTEVSGAHVADNFIDPGSDWMLTLVDSSDNIIERNLVEGGDAGIVLDGDCDRNLLFQNIVTGCAYDGFYLHAGADDNIIVHNTTHACPSGVVGATDTSLVENNLRADDGFVDPASYDFTLLPDSPHADAGQDLGYDLLPDLPGDFLGAAPDLGAVESY